MVGCDVRNAERVHPEWEVKVGDGLTLHPDMPPVAVVEVETSWLFFLEPLGPARCRFISRYRAATSDDLSMTLTYGVVIEPIGFAMGRRMLLGVKERVERRQLRTKGRDPRGGCYHPAPGPRRPAPHPRCLMPPATPPQPKFFRTVAHLARWFAANGEKQTELWIGYYKKHTGRGGVIYQMALDEALCWGWIDGQVKSIDEACYMQRWTPRTPTSIWSDVNTRKVARLTAEGRMQPAGLAAFARRDEARAGIYAFEGKSLDFTPAMLERFKANAAAWAFWEKQPPGYKRTATHLVTSAKREDTRERRLAQVIDCSACGERIPQLISTTRKAT